MSTAYSSIQKFKTHRGGKSFVARFVRIGSRDLRRAGIAGDDVIIDVADGVITIRASSPPTSPTTRA